MDSRNSAETRFRSDGLTEPEFGVLPDRFELVGESSTGGMGTVRCAVDKKRNRRVAIKQIRFDFRHDAELHQRIETEARVMARLQHPHLAELVEFLDSSAGPCLVIEWIDGENLEQMVERSGPIQPAKAASWILDVADALHATHQAEIFHRDIKPSNLIVDRKEHVFLIDFGLAQMVVTPGQARLTEFGVVAGTPEYLAPELIHGKGQATAQSDLWSLAATFYYLLTGQIVRARDDERIPKAFRPVLLKALKPDPRERYSTVEEFQKALRYALKNLPAEPVEGRIASLSDTAPVQDLLCRTTPEADRIEVPAETKTKEPGETRPRSRRGFLAGVISASAGGFVIWNWAQSRPESAGASAELPKPTTLADLNPEPHKNVASPIADAPVAKPEPAWLDATSSLGADSKTVQTIQLAWQEQLKLPREVTNSLGMMFRVIPPGRFQMGAAIDEPGKGTDELRHEAAVSGPLLFQETPVTQRQWQQVMGTNPSLFQPSEHPDCLEFPVENISWDMTRQFLELLNRDFAIEGWRYRLPTETEWEYACRAGTVTAFSFGTALNGMEANCNGEIPYGMDPGPSLHRPSVVRQYAANAYGLYDMHGNIWEWCENTYIVDARLTASGGSGSERTMRGGSWNSLAVACRSAVRHARQAGNCDSTTGLRVVCEPVKDRA